MCVRRGINNDKRVNRIKVKQNSYKEIRLFRYGFNLMLELPKKTIPFGGKLWTGASGGSLASYLMLAIQPFFKSTCFIATH